MGNKEAAARLNKGTAVPSWALEKPSDNLPALVLVSLLNVFSSPHAVLQRNPLRAYVYKAVWATLFVAYSSNCQINVLGFLPSQEPKDGRWTTHREQIWGTGGTVVWAASGKHKGKRVEQEAKSQRVKVKQGKRKKSTESRGAGLSGALRPRAPRARRKDKIRILSLVCTTFSLPRTDTNPISHVSILDTLS